MSRESAGIDIISRPPRPFSRPPTALDAAALLRAATVVRQRRDVLDGLDLQPRGLQRRDRALAAAAGPLTFTSTSFMPNLIAFSAACCADIWPAKGVLLRLPLKPLVPALAQHSVSPLVSVMVIVVLLNVALMWATPTVTLRRALRRFVFATAGCLLVDLHDESS